jgi:crotonobetainyl-CoA:carnitine CoA-transferase CaiB-like acyl-CoA transferase
MGAEVIKVERIGGEETRYHGPWVRGQSAYWASHNSGKKSLSMDLRTEEGKEVLRELVKVSDVLLQNFRPGTIESMGFGYDVLSDLNPRIIMVNASAYGQFGPYSEKIGYGPIGECISGVTMTIGEEGWPPVQARVSLIDRTTALHAAIGVLSALRERDSSGLGQTIDVCLADSGYSYTEIPVSAYVGSGIEPKRGEGGGAPPSGIYPCKDGHVLITAGDQHQWHRVCNALGKPDWLEDPRFTNRSERGKNREAVDAAVREVLVNKTPPEAVEHFTRHDVTIAAVNTIKMAAEDPHPWERGILVEVPDFRAGTMPVNGDYWHMSRTPAVIGSLPAVGEHNEEVLSSILGYSEERISELSEKNVISESDLYDELAG